MGRVERQMNDAGGDLRDIKLAVNGITAHLMSSSIRHEGSVLTAYADDDRVVWKEFRRELVEDGFSSSVIRKHKSLIKAYIEELGNRGLFDEVDPNDDAEERYCYAASVVEGATAYYPESQSDPEASLRSEADVELPIESKTPPDFDTEPIAASHLPAEPGRNEEPIHQPASRAADRARQIREEQEEENSERRRAAYHDRLPRLGDEEFKRRVLSLNKPKPELRWIWLSNKSNEENQLFPVEEIAAPKPEHGSSTVTTDGDHDGSDDAGNSPRWSVSSVAGEGSDIEEEDSRYLFHKSLDGRDDLLHFAAPSRRHIPAPHVHHRMDHLERQNRRIRRGSVSSTVCDDGHAKVYTRWDFSPPSSAASSDTNLPLHKSQREIC